MFRSIRIVRLAAAIALLSGAGTLVVASEQASTKQARKPAVTQTRTAAQRAQAQAKAKAEQSAALSRMQAKIRAFEQEQQRKIAADTAQMQAELARLRQQHKIRQEAIELNTRMRTASPAQREALNRRAAELLDQLQKLGVRIK